MGKWKQVSGDVNWASHGVVLARLNKNSRDVDLVRIEPWIEHDSSAIPTHGLYIVSRGTFDYRDMGVDKKNVQGALRSSGMDEDEYKKLPPEHKAEVIASYEGYGGEEYSTSDLLDALPAKPGEIEFWHGKATEESVRKEEDSMRREALDKCFDTRFEIGEMPDKKAMEFAWGRDEAWEFHLDENERVGLGYAKLFHEIDDSGFNDKSGKWTIDELASFTKIVKALAQAPRGKDVKNLTKVWGYLGKPDFGDVDSAEEKERLEESADEMSESAQELAVSLMDHLGFSWR
jgi:hypothetical protein